MLAFEGKGILLPVVVVLSQVFAAFCTGIVHHLLPGYAPHYFPFFLSLSSGLAIGSAWVYFIKDTYYYKDGKKVVLHEVENSFCYISLGHWVHILNVAAIICLVEWFWEL